MKTLLILSFICSIFLGNAQNEWWNTSGETKQGDTTIVVTEGKVTVDYDSRVDKMITAKGMTIPPAYGPQLDGYRVQIFFDSDKSKVNQARASFVAAYPEQDTYIEFRAPNFHLKAGNFRTQLEAERLKSELIMQFPMCIIVPEKIYYPKLLK